MRSVRGNKVDGAPNNPKVFGYTSANQQNVEVNNPPFDGMSKINYYTSVPSLLFATTDAKGRGKSRSGSVNNPMAFSTGRSTSSRGRYFDNFSNASRRFDGQDIYSNSDAYRLNYYSPYSGQRMRGRSVNSGDALFGQGFGVKPRTFRSSGQRSLRSLERGYEPEPEVNIGYPEVDPNEFNVPNVETYDNSNTGTIRDEISATETSNTVGRKTKTRIDPNTIPYLFSDFSEGLAQVCPDVIGFLPKWQKDFLSALIPLENLQVKRWYQGMMLHMDKIGYPLIHDELLYKSEIVHTAQEVVTKHRMNICGGITYSIRVMVTGPRESGKSVLHSAICRQVLIDLVATNNWKQTFIFAINLDTFANASRTVERLYQEIVDSTFNSLSILRPLVQRHLESLIKAFRDAPSGHYNLSKAFTTDEDFRFVAPMLTEHLRKIASAYRNYGEDYSEFISLTVQLPLRISEIFGFRKIILFVDHWDNTEVGDEVEFSEERASYLNECIKQLFNNTFFIAACKDSNRSFELSKPSNNRSTDLTNNCHYVTTLDLVQFPKYTEREFLVYFKEDPSKCPITVESFGGCTGYLIYWEELNEIVADIEHFEENVEEEENADLEAEESRLLLQSRMQDIIPRVINFEREMEIRAVTIVYRAKHDDQNESLNSNGMRSMSASKTSTARLSSGRNW